MDADTRWEGSGWRFGASSRYVLRGCVSGVVGWWWVWVYWVWGLGMALATEVRGRDYAVICLGVVMKTCRAKILDARKYAVEVR